jgi:hypothetical protein
MQRPEAFMPKSIDERGLLRPADIAKLQRVFDEACRHRHASPDSDDAKDIALTLLALHNAGMVDETMLMDAVAFPRIDSRSA